MSEQETSETNKLMIVEGRKEKRTSMIAASSSPLTFQRQVVGRHVVYQSSDGTKLRSMAEARRYFKHKGHVFIDSQFDFVPPALETETKRKASPSESPSSSKSNRGRPRGGGSAAGTKSPPKLATTRRKELVDDLKTIQDSLKVEGDAEIHGSPNKSSGRARGRPKRQDNLAPVVTEPLVDIFSDPLLKAEDLVNEEPGLNQGTSADGNKNRPARQRRPNQRYTDLVSESEPSRKKPRKDSGTSSFVHVSDFIEPILAASTPIPKASVGPFMPVPKNLAALKFGRMDTPQLPKTKAALKQPSMNRMKAKNTPTPRRVFGTQPKFQVQPIRAPGMQSTMSEMLADRGVSLSPLSGGEFEAPPEFVEIQESATPQDEQLPPVLPAAPSTLPSSSYFSHSHLSSGASFAPASTSATSDAFKRYESSGPSTNAYGEEERFDDQYTDDKLIQNPVKRGRKPNTGMNALVPRQSMERSLLGETSSRRYPSNSFFAGDTRRRTGTPKYDYGTQGIKVLGQSSTIDASAYYETNHTNYRHFQPPRGLAKLQQPRDPRRYMLGRIGATSASTAMIDDPPPQLDDYGHVAVGDTYKIGKMHLQQRGNRQMDSHVDPNLFCQLPPEVVSDHCYGRQLNAPAEADDASKTQMKSGPLATKSRNGQLYGSPPSLQRVEPQPQQRRPHYERTVNRQHFKTPSPPPYQSQRYASTTTFHSYHGMDVGAYGDGLRTSGAGVSTMGGQQMAIVSDNLPANILEEDDGEVLEHVASINID